MNAAKKMKVAVLCVSVAFHLGILFCVAFNVAIKDVQVEEAAPFRIVDLSEYVEASPPPVLKPPAKEPPPEIQVEETQEEIAEILVETEKEQAVNPEVAINEAYQSDVAAIGEGQNNARQSSGETPAARYIQENYTYVQRRILQELIYPSRARRTGIQGVVEVVFTIDVNGSAVDISIRRSSGKVILDKEAIRAVQSASPFRRPQEAVRIVIPVSFKLT